jgi:hypothetical protein
MNEDYVAAASTAEHVAEVRYYAEQVGSLADLTSV